MHKKLRQIEIDGLPYVWRVVWSKTDFAPSGGYGEFFVAWLKERKSSPVKIMFSAPEGHHFYGFLGIESSGNTLQRNQVRIKDFLLPESWRGSYPRDLSFNAYLPHVATYLIKYARSKGWVPEVSARPLILDIGPDLLEEKIP